MEIHIRTLRTMLRSEAHFVDFKHLFLNPLVTVFISLPVLFAGEQINKVLVLEWLL